MTYNDKAAKLSLPQYDKMPIFMDEDDISSYAKSSLYLSSTQTISGYPSGKILPKNTNRAEHALLSITY